MNWVKTSRAYSIALTQGSGFKAFISKVVKITSFSFMLERRKLVKGFSPKLTLKIRCLIRVKCYIGGTICSN